ncbi:MAG: putative purine-cytosine permease yxlA [Acidimicrobiaceae bacterium]|nr:putative purine-cytosine permease yxlA [Acidimicrobiaceae bacterium]
MTRATIEVRHLDHVPENEWHGKVWRQGPFWFLGNFQPFTLALAFVGPLVGLNGLWTSLAGITGILFGATFMAAHAAQGPVLGLPQMIQSRAQFGYRGVIVPLVATTLTFIGFNVVTVVIIKQGLFDIFGWNETVVAVLVSAAATLVAIYGHDWIHRVVLSVFWVSLPLWIALSLGILAHHAGGQGSLTGGFSAVGFFAMFTVAASYNITYAPCVSDYSRYLPPDTSRWRISLAVFLGAIGSPLWLIPLGAWMATRLHVGDALTGIYVAGNATVARLGTVLALVAVAALVAAMSISAYSGMLSILTVVDSFRPVRSGARARVVTVLALAVVSFTLGVMFENATTVLSDWLIVMLYLLAPWTSINLVDFYFVRRASFAAEDFTSPHGTSGMWRRRGIGAYFLGIAVEVPFMSIPNFYQSPGTRWLHGVDISWIIGLLVAGGAYHFASRHSSVVSTGPRD